VIHLLLAVGANGQPVTVTNPTEAGGLTTPDLLAIVAIIVTLLGLLLTAIGVLVLRQFSNMDARMAEQKTDNANTITMLRAENTNALNAVWRELGLIRSRLFHDTTPPGQYPPE
jgi:hypothetical protein